MCDILKQLGRSPGQVTLCSGTLTIPIGDIIGDIQTQEYRGSCLGLRFLHPVWFIDDVEVTNCEHTNRSTRSNLDKKLKALDFQPFLSQNVSNRRKLNPQEVALFVNKADRQRQRKVEQEQQSGLQQDGQLLDQPRYPIGSNVYVKRSDGEECIAIVTKYDAAKNFYTVELEQAGSGKLKQCREDAMRNGPSVRDADQLRREAELKAEAAERLRKQEAEERDKQIKEATARLEEKLAKAERDAEEFQKKTDLEKKEFLRRQNSLEGQRSKAEEKAKAEREKREEAEKKRAEEADGFLKRLNPLEERDKIRAPPDYWDKKMAEKAADGFAAIALNKTDPTFAALGRFLETDKVKLAKSGADRAGTSHDTLKLACAWRLENPSLWDTYMSGVQMVGKDMERIKAAGVTAGSVPVMTGSVASSLPGQLRANVNEAFLMHGTVPHVVLQIISKGMNERFAGAAAGTMFGQGSYLAEDAGKCDQYTMMDMQLNAGNASDLHKRLYSPSVPHPGKVFYILVCRVALGFHVRIQTNSRPFKSADTGQPVFPVNERELGPVPGISAPAILHHSLLADVLHIMRYRELLVFHSDYIYPEYLLGYQRFQSVGGSLKGPYDGVSH
ncbi:kinase domain-containing protein [Chrysochromulina tobinii]|uniref:Kinase domain-containing protein n=1 Tax=Chrysochromulina tobinii TaxID=1460289 RepID=A0A0M0JNS4_9EUKA|nr:kinase domain-containing protein [Chrysochromulina tobinii]|eukprot:KOO28135.1 kinase domain-containing protein [Chrysochromulina sp. CCMP291]